MKQIGNLAVVCATKQDVLFQSFNGIVSIHLGNGPSREVISTSWNNDPKISSIIHELNFGKYRDSNNNNNNGDAA